MKHISLFNKTIIALLISAIIFSTSCRKQESPKLPQPKQQAEQTLDKAGWVILAVIAAVTIAVIEVTEGHYHKKVVTKPDGTQSTEEWCEGNFGHCSIHARATGLPSNPTGLTNISSQSVGEEYDFKGSCELALTKDDRVVLLVPNNPENAEFIKNFLYEKAIEITKPLVIDNPEVLEILHRGYVNDITVKGTYEVYNAKEGMFIYID